MDLDTEQKELTSSSKCANCGSELFFDPKSKGLKCNSCGSIFNFPITVSNEKHDLNLSKQSFDTDNWAEENKMVKSSAYVHKGWQTYSPPSNSV